MTFPLLALGALAAALQPPGAASTAGERIYRQCFACHALEPGRHTPAGPSLAGIVGRPIAAQPGFNYSPALRRFAARELRWTPALLDRFLADPEAAVPGTEMGLVGMRDPRERRILIEWLSRRPRN
ncbi:MAG: cytochrome c family protein [Sphingomonas sp.]